MPNAPENNVISFRSQRFVGQTPPLARSEMQLLLLLHGSGELQTAASRTQMQIGDVISIRPGVVFSLRDCIALQLVACSLHPTEFREGVGAALDAKALSILLDAAEVKRYPIALEKFRSIAALLVGHPPGQAMGNIGRMLLLLEAIVEHCKNPVPQVHKAVFEAVRHFDRRLDHDWTLPEIAGAVERDPSYLARLFTSNVDAPPLAYLALLRAEHAAQLLIRQKLTCAAIGEMVGWRDPNYFSRRFRHHFGQSPTTFRDSFATTDARN
jgi:AraC family L-rhamnose operon transcriptional activator RhaR